MLQGSGQESCLLYHSSVHLLSGSLIPVYKNIVGNFQNPVVFFPANPSNFWSFCQMSLSACPTKAAWNMQRFSGASGLNGVHTLKASHNLSQKSAGLSSGFCRTSDNSVMLVVFLAPAFIPWRKVSSHLSNPTLPTSVLASQWGSSSGIASCIQVSKSRFPSGA